MQKTILSLLLPDVTESLLTACRSSSKSVASLLRRAKQSNFSCSMDALKFKLLADHVPALLPIARMSALGDGLADHSYWMRADPMHLTVDLAHVYYLQEQPLGLQESEVAQLAEEVQSLFTAFDLLLKTPCAERWYLQCPTIPKITTVSPQDFQGKSLMNFFPEGEERDFWRRLLTEVQMLLQSSDVNKKRATSSKATVNALWFWGQSDAEVQRGSVMYNNILTDEPVLLGLSKQLGYETIEFDDSLTRLENASFQGGNYLLAPTSLFSSAMSFADKCFIVENYFSCLASLLKHRKIDQLLLYLGDKHCYHVAANAYRWWQCW